VPSHGAPGASKVVALSKGASANGDVKSSAPQHRRAPTSAGVEGAAANGELESAIKSEHHHEVFGDLSDVPAQVRGVLTKSDQETFEELRLSVLAASGANTRASYTVPKEKRSAGSAVQAAADPTAVVLSTSTRPAPKFAAFFVDATPTPAERSNIANGHASVSINTGALPSDAVGGRRDVGHHNDPTKHSDDDQDDGHVDGDGNSSDSSTGDRNGLNSTQDRDQDQDQDQDDDDDDASSAAAPTFPEFPDSPALRAALESAWANVVLVEKSERARFEACRAAVFEAAWRAGYEAARSPHRAAESSRGVSGVAVEATAVATVVDAKSPVNRDSSDSGRPPSASPQPLPPTTRTTTTAAATAAEPRPRVVPPHPVPPPRAPTAGDGTTATHTNRSNGAVAGGHSLPTAPATAGIEGELGNESRTIHGPAPMPVAASYPHTKANGVGSPSTADSNGSENGTPSRADGKPSWTVFQVDVGTGEIVYPRVFG
jgi:hypothetical protein